MGMLVLVGTIVNNGIVLVDYTNLLRKRGLQLEEACVQAARNRLRPILMSTLTTVISLMPMAFFPGEGSASMQPISLTVFGGMTFGSLMTLFLMPTVYYIVNNRRIKKAAKRKARRIAREEAKKGNVRKQNGKKFDVEVVNEDGESVLITADGGRGDLNKEEKKIADTSVVLEDEAKVVEKRRERKPRAKKEVKADSANIAPDGEKPKRGRKTTEKKQSEDEE
jgi:HAE1 family hydrophobic/amphiphilic exporter-1